MNHTSTMYKEIFEQPNVLMALVNGYVSWDKSIGTELANARNLILAGTGASLIACEAAKSAFVLAGLMPHATAAADLPTFAKAFTPTDLVILMSQSGRSLETQEALQHISTSGAKLWSITNDPNSPLALAGERCFNLEAGIEVSSATKTYTATLMTLYLLAASAIRCSYGVTEERKCLASIESVSGAVLSALNSSEAITIVDIATRLLTERKDGPCWVLGTELQGPTAKQAALMLKEKALLACEGSSLSEFRHGPIEALRLGMPIFLTHGRGFRQTNFAQAQADYFLELGAMTTTLGPCRMSEAILACHEHIELVVPYQLIAEKCAGILGLDADTFIHLSKVVDKY